MYMLFIADDHRLFVDGLRFIIDYATDYKLAGVVHNGNEVMPFLKKRPVDVLLLDIDLPGKSGREVAVEVKRHYPLVKILTLSMHNDYDTVKTMLGLGVTGYCLKTAGKDELLTALANVSKGEVFISGELMPVLLNGGRFTAAKSKPNPIKDLTEREQVLLSALARGKNVATIADEINLSKHTVESHRKNIYSKLNLHSVGELMSFVRENGLYEAN
jgi:DNA-binding NarL/FixJ family response regulator